MKYLDVNLRVSEICKSTSVPPHSLRPDLFKYRTDLLFTFLGSINRTDVLQHLEYGGVIPESYPHDSSEEKLFAKYCDFLLASGLRLLGLKSEVINERADAADVTAKSTTYSLVGDAKAFRLSRTAKNQKDFKVEALSQWKKTADYAVLVCPYYQYPSRNSQIFEQAIRYNVTLLSFYHIAFIVRSGLQDPETLIPLWQLGNSLAPSKDAVAYWNALNEILCSILKVPRSSWAEYLHGTRAFVLEQAQAEVQFWENEKSRISKMSHKEAVEGLIKAMRIDSNISLIRGTISELGATEVE